MSLSEDERTELAKRLLRSVASPAALARAEAKLTAGEELTPEENRLLFDDWVTVGEQGPISDETAGVGAE